MLERLVKILEDKVKNELEHPYQTQTVGLKIEIDPNRDVFIRLYNSYHFRQHLRKAGFIFDSDSWLGDLNNLFALDNVVLKRLIEAISLNSARKYLKIIREEFFS